MQRYRAIFGQAADFPAVADDLYRLRKRIFVDDYGWELPTDGDREVDQFDTPSTVHCALYCDEVLSGTFRAIRCDRPYLAASVFPQLATKTTYPRHLDAWEISRFGVVSGSLRLAHINYALMFLFARAVQATALVAIADLTYERFLRSIGVNTVRYGPPQAIGRDCRGNTLHAVAGEIPLSMQSGPKFQSLLQKVAAVEIEDASHVFGYRKISA